MRDNNVQSAIESAIAVLQQAERLTLLTGAGVSAESGIPTFRDKQTGLWENYRAEALASISAFNQNPELVWRWYQWRRRTIEDNQPNPAHYAIAQLQTLDSPAVTLISQNVDDLHEQAGSTVHKLHGYLWRNHCQDCGQTDEMPDIDTDELQYCTYCQGLMRPSVVWFGESLPVQPWQIATDATSHCDVFMSIGTSSMVNPAAGLVGLAKQCGATVIEVNPNPTTSSEVDIQIAESAGIVLPKLVAALTD